MAENLKVGGKVFVGVKYVTFLDDKGNEVRYYEEGEGGGGGSGMNYRTATKEELDEIIQKVVI